jgi:GNAT superfamily N-acetyltransferase
LVIEEIFVHPEHQKKGVGSELTRTLLKAALDQHDVTRVEAFTFKKTAHPRRWYKGIGFDEIKEWTIIGGDAEDILKNLVSKKVKEKDLEER